MINRQPIRTRRLGVPSAETGEGRLATVFWLLVVIWLFMAGFEYLPKRYQVAQFQDAIVDGAEGASRNTSSRLKGQLLWRAQQLDLPITKDDIEVAITGDYVKITAAYTIPVDLPLYSYDWHVTHEERRRLFRF